MIDVRPFDECLEAGAPRPPLAAWHQGTLHHIFREGWMWVIPFNNHPESTNPVVSVGLQLDPRRRPKPAGDPLDEFKALSPTIRTSRRSSPTPSRSANG